MPKIKKTKLIAMDMANAVQLTGDVPKKLDLKA